MQTPLSGARRHPGDAHRRGRAGLIRPLDSDQRMTTVLHVTPDMTIASVVDRWPDAARIFARYGLGCASCAISKAETIAQAAAGHGAGRVKLDDLVGELNDYAATGKLPEGLPAAADTAGGVGGKVPRGMAEQKGIKHVIAVMSGKGGVGKSLVAGLLAVGLARRGRSEEH